MKPSRAFFFLVLPALAGLVTAVVLAVPVALAQEGTGTDTTATESTPTETTGTDSTATDTGTEPPPSGPRVIQPGVTIGGILVGGLTGPEARALVQRRFAKQFVMIVSPTRKVRATPQELGAAPFLGRGVKRALKATRPGARVPLPVKLSPPKLEAFAAGLAELLATEPRDARLRLKGAVPVVIPDVPGRRLKEGQLVARLRQMLRTHARDSFQLPFRPVRALVSAVSFAQIIVIRRESKMLSYYQNLKLKRTFRVATGQSSYPTPLGRFEVVVKQRNPWWYPPDSEWAKDAKPIPPGPGNPLGTRWLGLSAPLIGIHGTPDAASIGYSASHGCVRMLIPQVEWLFEKVRVGATVFIVPR